ncbi:MAG: DNA-directed RNA polymerase subunit beta [Dehalococcoidia bacterium]
MVIADRKLLASEHSKYKSFTTSVNSSNSSVSIPNLLQVQINSFEWFKKQGLKDLLSEINPIEDFTGGRFELKFLGHEIRGPKKLKVKIDKEDGSVEQKEIDLDELESRKREITYAAPLYVTVQLVIRETGEIKEQTLFFGDIPMMTKNGTFIINGAERVVVSQLVRSPGAYFTTATDISTGRELCNAKLIPYRGAWIELETSIKDILTVKIDRKRKAPITTLLRALGWESDKEILDLFSDIDDNPDHKYIESTLKRDTASTNREEALLEFYRRLRPGEPPNLENAEELIQSLFFNDRKYDLGRVGRYKLNKRLELDVKKRTLTKNDFVQMIRRMIGINNGKVTRDDIDHLGNRRVRAVGELVQNQIRVGLLRMERVVKERMSTQMDSTSTTPAALVNIRPIVASVREFFGGSQLSQFMDQTNPLSELTHKRRLSALGPGGLSRERAGFDVRDVHSSHYGRICPIETPEGPNIGLLGSFSTFARLNDYGFIETLYRKVSKKIKSNDKNLVGKTLTDDIKEISQAKSNTIITIEIAEKINELNPVSDISVKPYITDSKDDLVYLSADDEEKYIIGQANTVIDSNGQISSELVEVREGGAESFSKVPNNQIDYIDVSPMQIVSVSTALIPFLEHDDANRALMGSNMQRQAVPLLIPQAPLVGTGMEWRVAQDSGQVLLSEVNGVVTSSTSDTVSVIDKNGKKHNYDLIKYDRSNQGTSINQHPIVNKGDLITEGSPLADSSSTDNGELALGQNLIVGFMSFNGYNYEDAIILNEDLVKYDRFTSIHIEKHEIEARDTKLGPEEITRDIPNVGEESLRDLDEEGIVRIGAWVSAGDILVGKITPKGETELTAEEKLLRAIFGEKARDVKDSSLRVPHGQSGKVIDVRVLTKQSGDHLSAGVTKLIRVWIAHTRKISQGDKMAGRHGNKGVVAKILPREDMPYLEDGTPLDIVLNPIGVPSRMNLGQLLETHLGWAAHSLNYTARTPVFDSASDVVIEDQLARAWFVSESKANEPNDIDSKNVNWDKVEQYLDEKGFDKDKLWSDATSNRGTARQACMQIWLKDYCDFDASKLKPTEVMQKCLSISRENNLSAPIFGKQKVIDGATGIPFDQPITVGNVYILKLIHLVEDKIHARSTGPYSLITQQPLGGKAQFGGQRFGEMEVWALEAYSAAYTLQEMLTVKSDDVIGRVKAYEAIVKGEEIIQPGLPESFHVLLKELQGLGLSVELLNEDIDKYIDLEKSDKDDGITTPIGWDDISEEPLELLEIEELNLNDNSNVVSEDTDDESEESDEGENEEQIDDDSVVNLEEGQIEEIDESILDIEFENIDSEDSETKDNIEEPELED